MQFVLPELSKLTQEQLNLINLDLDQGRQHLVVQGFAGTGKTVVAYYRAIKGEKKGKKICVLCFGKVLHSLLTSAKGSKDVLINKKHVYWADGLYSGIKKNLRNSSDKRVSSLAEQILEKEISGFNGPNLGLQNKEFLVELFTFYNKHCKGEKDFLYDEIIIDEGQDLTKDFLEALKCITNHISIFADDNQWIFKSGDKKLTVLDMVNILIPNEEPEYLTSNFRTTQQICTFAAEHFLPQNEKIRAITESKTCKDDPDSNPLIFGPKLYQKNGIEEFLGTFITKQWAHYDSILLVASNQKSVEWLSKCLSKKELPHSIYHANLSHEFWEISPYAESGLGRAVLVTTYHSSKGLEADCVFIYMTQEDYQATKGDDRNIFYVLSTRAKKKLFIITDFNFE